MITQIERKVLVPVELWAGNSPDLMLQGLKLDMGALGESLLIYDTIYVNLSDKDQMTGLIEWFVKTKSFDELVSLIRLKRIVFYYHNFWTPPIYDPENQSWILVNVREDSLEKPFDLFVKRTFPANIWELAGTRHKAAKFREAIEESIVIVEADEFGKTVEDAKEIIHNPKACKSIYDNIIKSLNPLGSLESVPEPKLWYDNTGDGRKRLHSNIDFAKLGEKIDKRLNIGSHTPLALASISNRHVWSAKSIDADLYVSDPGFSFLKEELEDFRHSSRVADNLSLLFTQIEIPRIREAINSDQIEARAILTLRHDSERFRHWFHSRSDQNADIVYSYLHDNEPYFGEKFKNIGTKTVQILSFTAKKIIEKAVTPEYELPVAICGEFVSSYMNDVAKRMLSKGWSPKLFGNKLSHALQGDK